MTTPSNPGGGQHYDVVVLGGGTAGVAAAISAARGGATVLLLERSDILGGNATQAFVHSFCGLYLPPGDGKFHYANPGFAQRLAEWLIVRGGALPPEVQGKVGVLPIRPEKLGDLLSEACAGVTGLDVAFLTVLQEVCPLKDGGGFSMEFIKAGREMTCRAKYLIDTSGDARVAEAIGAPMDASTPEELQHSTFIFRVSGAHEPDLVGFQRLKLSAAFNRAARSGRLPPECDSVLVRPTGCPGEAFISLNMPKPPGEVYNPLDDKFLRQMETIGRERAEAMLEFLRQEVGGWQACNVLEWPRRLGIRETRRVRGIYTMTTDDVVNGRKFPAQIALSTWPIELWKRHTGAEFQHPTAPCEIPIEALISSGNPRLGMAGRCMSASHEAMGALRVMGTAMATGEAIGLAAALAARENSPLDKVRAEDVRESRRTIHQLAGEKP